MGSSAPRADAAVRARIPSRQLELRLECDLLEASALARQSPVERGERLFGVGSDEEPRHVVRELVAGRSLHRPRAETLVLRQDLLDPDPPCRRRAQPFEILARVRETVWMIDPQPVDEAIADQLEDLRVRRLEHRFVLLPDPGELADVEEPAMKPSRRSTSKNRFRSSRSRQNGFSSDVARWFGTMSRITSSPVAQRLRNAPSPPSSSRTRVGSVPSYPCCGRAAPRGLATDRGATRRRLQVRHDTLRLREADSGVSCSR